MDQLYNQESEPSEETKFEQQTIPVWAHHEYKPPSIRRNKQQPDYDDYGEDEYYEALAGIDTNNTTF